MTTRLAVTISSDYSENGVLLPRDRFDDTALLVGEQLSTLGTGFEVVNLRATRDLPEELEGLLSNRPKRLEQLLIHFCGYLAVKPDRGLALVLDGARLRAFPISRLRSALSPAADQTLVVFDALAVAEGTGSLDEVAAGLGVSLNAVSPQIGVLASVVMQEDVDPLRRGCLRLSDLWMLSLEYRMRHANGNPISASLLVRDIQHETLSFGSLPSFDYQPSVPEFAVIPGSGLASDAEPPTQRQSSRPSPVVLPLPMPPGGRPPLPRLGVLPPGAPMPPPPMVTAWSGEADYYPSVPPPEVAAKNDTDQISALQAALMQSPQDLDCLRALSDAAQRQRDVVTAALASSILVSLNAARPEDEVRQAKLVSDGLPLAQRTLNDNDFDELMLSLDLDCELLRALGWLSEPALASGLGYDADYEELPKDATVLDPETSTVTLGRSLVWVCKFLGVHTPELIVLPDMPNTMALTLSGGGRLLVSRQLGSGLSLAQLAFLGARQLVMLRPEFKWRVTLDNATRLGRIVECCIGYCREGRDYAKFAADSEKKAVKRLLAQIETDPSLGARVTQQFAGLELDSAECNALSCHILTATDRVLIRSGLLACANPAAAWELTQRFELQSTLGLEEQFDEIARYTMSREHLALRASLGLAANRR